MEGSATLSPEQIELVRTSWEQVMPRSDLTAALLFEGPYKFDPQLKPLLVTEIKQHGRRLMPKITAPGLGVIKPAKSVPMSEDPGRRQGCYGLQNSRFDSVDATFPWSLGKGLGTRFSTELKVAWATVFTLLATTMKHAGAQTGASLITDSVVC